MGQYLNPGNSDYQRLCKTEVFVDKSLLIEKLNKALPTRDNYICVSRPRRFGKTCDADMLVAYYSKGCDSHELFNHLNIAFVDSYEIHLNKHNVIHLNIQSFLSKEKEITALIAYLTKYVFLELKEAFPDVQYTDTNHLDMIFNDIYLQARESFLFVVDEWDCIFREKQYDKDAQKQYLDFLRNLWKDQSYVDMVYMTGILPIKKYGTHSALNMFAEISMIDPKIYSEFMGFTDEEVKELCEKFNKDYSQMKYWYDGYHLKDGISTYSPRSVSASIAYGDYASYWTQTETFEALKIYIDLNMDGLKDAIVEMLNGKEIAIDTSSFQNDMTSFETKNDVLTLLIHLGYLGYNSDEETAYIPNREVRDSFTTSIKASNWGIVTKMLNDSRVLLDATLSLDEEKVAKMIEETHLETQALTYNSEAALSYTIQMAYYAANKDYTLVKEFPCGKGYADIVFIPFKANKPAMVVELKWEKDALSAIEQIKEKRYPESLKHYLDRLLLVGINYDSTTKKHKCIIENYRQD